MPFLKVLYDQNIMESFNMALLVDPWYPHKSGRCLTFLELVRGIDRQLNTNLGVTSIGEMNHMDRISMHQHIVLT